MIMKSLRIVADAKSPEMKKNHDSYAMYIYNGIIEIITVRKLLVDLQSPTQI